MKIPKQNLRIPGPTPCPDEIMELMSSPMINHRGPEFKELLYSVTDRLQARLFRPVTIFTSSPPPAPGT